MFEIKESYDVRVDYVYDSPIYTIDDFYQDPDSIVEFLMSQDAPLWKMEEEFKPSHNEIYFEDRKHQIESSEIESAYYFLQSICKQKIDCLSVLFVTKTIYLIDFLSFYVMSFKN